MTIDQTNWHIEFGGPSAIDLIVGRQKTAQILDFASCWDLEVHLADDANDHYLPVHRYAEERLVADATFRSWKKARIPLNELAN